MKAFSSALSVTVHVAVGAAVLFGSTKGAQPAPDRPIDRTIYFEPRTEDESGNGAGFAVPMPNLNIDTRSIAVPSTTTIDDLLSNAMSSAFSPSSRALPASGSGVDGWSSALDEEAQLLTGPLPRYPELLRQAGVQGEVVLQAVVDSSGRVIPQSISVVSATNPGFVAAARQALLTSLFRPAMTGGRPVRMLIRIPYAFTIRNGMGRAR